MRIQAVFRVRALVRTLVQKLRRTAVLVVVLGLLASSLVVGKNAFVGEVRRQVRKTFVYDRMSLSYLPPALVLDNVRSLAGAPAFRAKRVRIELPFLSLLRNQKTLLVTLESPEIRISPSAGRPKSRKPPAALSLPFTIERGVILDGQVVFETGNATLEVRGLGALVTQKGDAFTVQASARRAAYSAPSIGLEFGGALDLAASGRGEDVTVERLSVEGPDVSLNAKGRVRKFLSPEFELETRLNIETAFLEAVLRLPFEWKGKIGVDGSLRRPAEGVSVQAQLASDGLELSGVPMGRLRGRFGLAPGRGGRLEFDIQKPGRAAESLVLTFQNGRVEGRAAPVYVDPVFRDLDIPWPVKSPAWGTFALERRRLAVDAEFRDSSLDRDGELFSFRGLSHVDVDFAKKHVAVRTPGLESNFGRLEAAASIDLAGEMDTRIKGSVFDVKQTREFVSLALGQAFGFGEIRGAGYADVALRGRSKSPVVSLKATLTPGGFERFNAASVEANAVVSAAGLEGTFLVDDPELKGRVEIKAAGDSTDVRVVGGDGELARVLAGFELPVALAGRTSGDFRMVVKNGRQEFAGAFSSPEIRGYGEEGRRVEGRLEWKDGVLSFPELRLDFYGGRVDGRLAVGTETKEFDVDMRGEELDFGRVVPGAAGRLSLALKGQGVFGRDKLGGLFSVKQMLMSPLKETEARGDLELDIRKGRVNVGLKGGLVPGDNPFEASLDFFPAKPYGGTVKGRLSNLDLIIPWRGAQGRIDYAAEIQGPTEPGPAHVTVNLDVAAPVMPLPGFAYALADFTVAARYRDGRLTVSSLGGRLGGGEVKGSGEVGMGDAGIESVDMTFEAKDMVLSPMERMRAQADATLRLLKDPRRFVTEGELLFRRLNWRREIYEEFGFSTPVETEEPAEPSFFDGMSLNLRLRADDNFLIENSLGRFNGRFNLTATGAFASPVLLGDIDLASGDLFFQDRTFRVIHGRLSFVDPLNTEPYLDFRGETYVKDYRVTLNMSGPVSRLKPEFSSSPPLPPEEVLSLLALGESFRRMSYSYSSDRSTALNTASLLTYQIADQAKRRTSGLFSLDRFRIDPYIPESAPGGIAARITVGKKVSRNVLLIYSTILANSSVMAGIEESPIFRMEWDISRKFSLVGGRDDRGRLSFDVKYRKRF